MTSEKEANITKRFIRFSEANADTVKIVSYGMASISLIIAINRIKPFAKFRKPSSVPSHFIHKKIPLEGTVMRIEPSCGVLLMTDHTPLLQLPLFKNSKYLPIKIAGINLTANGINWMQTIVNRKKIIFLPLVKEKEYLNCIVTVQQNEENIKIGEELVKLGFATVNQDTSQLMKDTENSNYYKHLLNAQKWAKQNRNGYWHFNLYPTLSWKIQQNIYKKINSLLPNIMIKNL